MNDRIPPDGLLLSSEQIENETELIPLITAEDEEQMNAEIAVQEKQRAVEDEKMKTVESIERKKGEIEEQKLLTRTALEEKRKKLVDLETQNSVAYARARAEAMRLEMEALSRLSPELLDVLAANQMSGKKLISRAMRDLAKNAQKIGHLNISPDLLTSLLSEE